MWQWFQAVSLALLAAVTAVVWVWANRHQKRQLAELHEKEELVQRVRRAEIPAVEFECGPLPPDDAEVASEERGEQSPEPTRLQVAPSSGKTLRARFDEDRFLGVTVLQGPTGRLLMMDAVFDGHGGSFAADFLAANCATFMRETLRKFPDAPLEKLLAVAIGRLEHAVLRELCWEDKLHHGAAGSICLTEHDGKEMLQIACGNLGDCEVVVMGRERLEALSEVHRLSNPSERRRVLELGGVICGKDRMCHLVRFREASPKQREDVTSYCAAGVAWEGSLNTSIQCTRSFGDFRWKHLAKGILNYERVLPYVQRSSPRWKQIERRLYSVLSGTPATRSVLLSTQEAEDAFLLIGSDGFWDAFPDKAALRELLLAQRRQGRSSDELCEALVALARLQIPDSLHSADDMTLVLVHLPTRIADHVRLATNPGRRRLFVDQDETS